MMKLVVNGFAGAGSVTIGGYDYHTGERGTGDGFHACPGAVAAVKGGFADPAVGIFHQGATL